MNVNEAIQPKLIPEHIVQLLTDLLIEVEQQRSDLKLARKIIGQRDHMIGQHRSNNKNLKAKLAQFEDVNKHAQFERHCISLRDKLNESEAKLIVAKQTIENHECALKASDDIIAQLKAKLVQIEKPWTVQIAIPSPQDPFGFEEAEIIDVGYADHILKVKSKKLSQFEGANKLIPEHIQSLIDYFYDTAALIEADYPEFDVNARDTIKEYIAALERENKQLKKDAKMTMPHKYSPELVEAALCVSKYAYMGHWMVDAVNVLAKHGFPVVPYDVKQTPEQNHARYLLKANEILQEQITVLEAALNGRRNRMRIGL